MSRRKPKAVYWQDAPMPREQMVLIPGRLDDMIPDDHPVRLLDELVDLLDWKEYESAYHGRCGQPPIHPSVLCKVLLFAMIRRIRSSRQIEYELRHAIDFMWLSSGREIDHTTLSEFRRKHADQLRDIFNQVIRRAIDLGVAKLSSLCIDGTRVLADANRYKTWTTDRLARALKLLDDQIAEALESLEVTDTLEADMWGEEESYDRLPKSIADLKTRRELLAKLLETTEQMDETRRHNGSKGPAQLPKTDTDSRILPNKEGGYAPNYTPMSTAETENGFVVHCDVVIGNVEHDQLLTIVDAVEADFKVEIESIMADTAYTTGSNLSGAEEAGIELIGPTAEVETENNPAIRADLTLPVPAESIGQLPINPQTKRFDKSAFIYDEQTDRYYCPAGKPLPHRTTEHTAYRGGQPVTRYIYTCQECSGCPLAEMCRRKPESKRGREIMHDEHEPARRRHRERMRTAEAKEKYKVRTHIGETPFAVIKAFFGLRRFLLRGLEGVRQEWRWASTAYNVKKLIRMMHLNPNLRFQIQG
ncbi:MAG: IS1182 family transposase [Pirellulales bacterium]